MNIYLNNVINASKMITFNNAPTIVYLDSFGDGSKAKMEITVGVGATLGEEYYFTVNGAKVVATIFLEEAVGNVFYTPFGTTGENYAKTSAYTLARALNNTQLSNDYDIYVESQNYANMTKVIIEAKEKGRRYNFKDIETNMSWLTYTTTDGTNSDLLDGTVVVCDVYANINEKTQNNINGEGSDLEHIGTFQKRYYKDGISFNISSVLNNITDFGKTIEYNVVISFILNGEMKYAGILKHNYAVNGYLVNLGLDFIQDVGDVYLAQNVFRGDERASYNNTTLYYTDNIAFSVYKGIKGTLSYTVNYLDSALNIVKSVPTTFNCNKALNHISFIPEKGYYYVDIVLPFGTIRYTNIKPEKYSNPSDQQTLYWYNSYGGVSFFPFTSKKEENRESEKILYKKTNSNYYNDRMKSYQKVYDIINEYEVTLQTHYMDKNGTYNLNDLLNSFQVWTYVEGKKYEVIVKSANVEENANNGVYLGTVKFNYSLPDRW